MKSDLHTNHLSPRSSTFSVLRSSLLTALGASFMASGVACGGVEVQGSGGNGGNGGNGGGTATNQTVCKDPKPLLQPSGADTGFVVCSDGSVNRMKPATCGVTVQTTCAGTETTLECTTNADCTALPNGSCLTYSVPGPGFTDTGCACSYECSSDSGCNSGEACACAGVGLNGVPYEGSYCIPSGDCQGPEDCPSGECGYSQYENGCYTERRLACRSAADECRTGADCMNGQQCAKVDTTSPWMCVSQTCTIGRPLIVQEEQRFAPSIRRTDWAATVRPDCTSLSPHLKAALAQHFRHMAAMEHASIASFARFSLELLALGAPPSLLLAVQKAGADEVVHAQRAYAMASAYSGEPTGPGRLNMTGVRPNTDEVDIVRALVVEACVGETIAAAEAMALAGMVTDPALKALYTQVSEDESRHAELGYRSLAWLLSVHPELTSVAQETFAIALASLSAEPVAATGIISEEHGLLSSASLGALRAQAAAEVVVPCRDAVLCPELNRHSTMPLKASVDHVGLS